MTKKKKEKARTLVSTTPLPCGCIELKYSDGDVSMKLCPAHGIDEAANALNRAAQALSCVAGFMLRATKEATMMQAVDSVLNNKDDEK